jgi:DNA-binding MarR family transcriptional regulator
VIEVAYKILDIHLGAFGKLRRVSVLVHLARRMPGEQVAYFIKVINLSTSRDIEVTHVWIAPQTQIPIPNDVRSLPVRLRPDETWETWVPFNAIPESLYSRVHRLVRVQLSNGSMIRSQLNKKVPPVGYVAGAVSGGAPAKTPARAKEQGLIEEERAIEPATLPADELAVLKMFVEFKDDHTAEDIANRFSLTKHKAEYVVDRLIDKRYLGETDRYRNARPILYLTRKGRDLLVEMGKA